jgi:hypothetical protein
MRTTALTAFGLIGTDWTRLTAVILETGAYVLRRADGTNTVVDVLPTRWRTSGDITASAALLGHRVNMAAVPSVGLKNHAWKGEYSLSDIAIHMIRDEDKTTSVVNGLYETYAEEVEAAA